MRPLAPTYQLFRRDTWHHCCLVPAQIWYGDAWDEPVYRRRPRLSGRGQPGSFLHLFKQQDCAKKITWLPTASSIRRNVNLALRFSCGSYSQPFIAYRVCLCLSCVIEYGNWSELSCRRSHLRIFGRETTLKFLSPALNNCERFSSSSGRVVVVVVVVVEVALVVVVLVVVGVVVVVLIFVRNYLNLYKVRVERAVPETRRGVSAPDFAVGADARVHNGWIRPSRAASARALLGTN